MDVDEYAQICSLAAYPTDGSLSVSAETFAVITQQKRHHQFIAALKFHRQNVKKYLARHSDAAQCESFCQIAKSVDFSPCMMARLLLEKKFQWTKTTITNIFKEALKDEEDIDTIEHDTGPEPNRRGLSKEEYTRVLQEVRDCIAEDSDCSPLADRIRRNVGEEFEYLLQETLRNRQLVFESEDMLREKGMAKTPDARLLLPIGVMDPKTGQVRVVNWIDSKAMFGDRHTHETENLEQLQGYVNRYGPGMVIYWFGHVAQLSSDSDIFATDVFPQEISLPGAFNPLALVTKVEEGTILPLQFAKTQQTDFDEDFIPITSCEL